MSISLKKNDTISLEKGGQGLTQIYMGLGWDVAKPKGFLGKLMGGGNEQIDLDASCLSFGQDRQHVETVYFGQLKSRDGSVRHGGDNLTGEGDGDDEKIYVDLTKVPAHVSALLFTVNSFRGQTFDKVANAFCRIVDDTNGKEVARLNLTEQGNHTGLLMVKVQREGSGWKLTAIGDRLAGRTAQDLVRDLPRYL